MGFNSAFKGLKLLKNPGSGRLHNLNDPNRPQCVKKFWAERSKDIDVVGKTMLKKDYGRLWTEFETSDQ